MFWKKEDGIAVAEMITLFALVSIMTFSALPFYNKLITQTHRIKVETMYNKIKTSVIISAADSASVSGVYKVPYANQISSKNFVNLSDPNSWMDNGTGTWTYLPTGAQIIYSRIKQDDYSLIIHYHD
ncbi:hypothetical protein KKF86_09860 [bacterium]|nr:hypothetical protein [bacterium]